MLATATIVEQDKETYTADLRLDSYVRDDAKFDAEEMNWDNTFKNVQDLASVVQVMFTGEFNALAALGC